MRCAEKVRPPPSDYGVANIRRSIDNCDAINMAPWSSCSRTVADHICVRIEIGTAGKSRAVAQERGVDDKSGVANSAPPLA
jgi:hypothetical protein